MLKWLLYLHSGEHHPTEYLAKRLEKESKIGLQLGTLGGGNHFLEVVYSEDDEQVGLIRWTYMKELADPLSQVVLSWLWGHGLDQNQGKAVTLYDYDDFNLR